MDKYGYNASDMYGLMANTIVADKKYPQELNDNFWRWFGNSETVDENGNPLIFYHGTRQRFNKFKGDYNNLIFFAYDKTVSERFSKEYKETYGNIYNKYYLKYKEYDEEIFKKFVRRLDYQPKIMPVYIKAEKIFNPERDYELVSKDFAMFTDRGISEVKRGYWKLYEDNPDIIDKIFNELGFDAIQLNESILLDDTKTLAIREKTNQVKSIYNNGNFSKRTNNIYK